MGGISGLPASLTTGEIIRHLRGRRGMSRAVLAGLVGYSDQWLKHVERGERGISLPALLRVARVLRVDDLSVLVDGDHPMPISEWDGPRHPAVTAVRDILGVMSFAPADRTEEPPDVDDLARQVADLWHGWHTLPGNMTMVASFLPAVIRELETATVVLDGRDRRRAHAVLASAYSLAQHLAVDLTEPEVGRVLVDRAAQAADDPVSLAFGAWSYGHVLRGLDADAAVHTVSAAADELGRRLDGDEDTAALLGSLHLHCAVSAAHTGADGPAWRWWDAADAIGRALQAGREHPQTAFGTGNVVIHAVSISSLLHRHGEVVQRAQDIDPETARSRERRGRLFGEIAASRLQRHEQDDALRYLELAYSAAPETTPYSPLTRGVAIELVRSTRGAMKARAVGLAERMAVLPSR